MKIFSHDAVVRTPPNACEMLCTKPSMELVFHAGPCAGKSPLLNSPLTESMLGLFWILLPSKLALQVWDYE